MQASGDHKVEDEEQIAFEREDDPLAEATEGRDSLSLARLDGGIERPEEKRAGHPDLFQPLPRDSRVKRLDVDDDIGQLRHAPLILATRRFLRHFSRYLDVSAVAG